MQKNKIEIKLFFIKIPASKVLNPKNKPKNAGIKIKEKGIKNSKLLSKVKE